MGESLGLHVCPPLLTYMSPKIHFHISGSKWLHVLPFSCPIGHMKMQIFMPCVNILEWHMSQKFYMMMTNSHYVLSTNKSVPFGLIPSHLYRGGGSLSLCFSIIFFLRDGKLLLQSMDIFPTPVSHLPKNKTSTSFGNSWGYVSLVDHVPPS